MFVALLDRVEFQPQHLAASQSAAEQQGHHRVVAQSAKGDPVLRAKEASALFRPEPVSQPHAEASHALDPANVCGQLRTEEAGIGRLIRDPRTAASRRLIVAGAQWRCSRWMR